MEIAFDAAGLVYCTLRSEAGSPAGLGRYDPIGDSFDFWLGPYTAATSPFGIVRVGTQLWFLDHHAGRLGRFDPATSSFLWADMPADAHPIGIARSGDGTVWFAQTGRQRTSIGVGVGVGRYTAPARPQVVPALGQLGLLGAAGVLTALGRAAMRRARPGTIRGRRGSAPCW